MSTLDDLQAQITQLKQQLAGKADLDPATSKLRRDQTADATADDVSAWLAAGVKAVPISTTPVTSPPAPPTATNLLPAATVATLAAGVAPGFVLGGVFAPGKYLLTGTNAVTGYDIGAKFTRQSNGSGDVAGYVKFQNGAQSLAFSLTEAGYFTVAGSNGTVKVQGAFLTKVS